MLQKVLALFNKDRIIKEQARRNKEIVYGARAMNAQLHPFVKRTTDDWDIYSNNPKGSAKQLEHKMNVTSGNGHFYTKSKKHRGTYGVYDKGLDERKGTDDDYGIADYTRMPKRRLAIVKRGGVAYVALPEIIKSKERTLRKEKYVYRHPKDISDIARMREKNI